MATTYPVAVHVKAKDSASEVIGRTARQIGRSLSGIRGQATSASSALSSVGASIREGTGRALLYGVGAIGAGMVGAGIAAKNWADGALEMSGELVDFRSKTGFAIEALQEWRYAANQSGVETSTFNAAIMNLSKQLGPLRNGTGKLAKYTKGTLNPALLAQVKATTSTEEALGLYIAALEEIEDPSKRAAAAQAIFGRAGKDMTALAAAGAVELKRLREEKRHDGVQSTETAEKNEALGDQVARLKGRYETFTTTIGSHFLAALEPHMAGLGQWFDRNQDVIGQNVAGGVEWLADAFSRIDWDAIASGARTVKDVFDGLYGVVSDVKEAIDLLPQFGEHIGTKAADWADERAFRNEQARLGRMIPDAQEKATEAAARAEALAALEPLGFASPQQRWGAYAYSLGEQQKLDALLEENRANESRYRGQRSGMYNLPVQGAGFFGRSMEALNAPRTAAERLNALPYGLGQVHSAGPPAPPQEVVIRVESEPGTTATVVKQPKSSNVRVGKRNVGTGPH